MVVRKIAVQSERNGKQAGCLRREFEMLRVGSADDGSDVLKRRVIEQLRPTLLDTMGLVSALRWQFQESCGRAGLQCTDTLPEDELEVEPEAATALFRMAQEAMTNINKHAEASTVDIDLSDREGVLTLEVTDNGKGLDAQALRKAKSFGLLGLRERAAKVDGWLDVSSSPRGTSVILSVPLPASRNPENAAKADEESNDQSDFV